MKQDPEDKIFTEVYAEFGMKPPKQPDAAPCDVCSSGTVPVEYAAAMHRENKTATCDSCHKTRSRR